VRRLRLMSIFKKYAYCLRREFIWLDEVD